MGGRGTSLDVGRYLSRSKAERTGEYTCIHQEGNVKFLVQNEGKRVTAPVFSNTENRIYVTLNRNGEISGITQYDENHQDVFSIHEKHSNESKGDSFHEHASLRSGRAKIEGRNMSQEHIQLYKYIKSIYNRYGLKNIAKNWRK